MPDGRVQALVTQQPTNLVQGDVIAEPQGGRELAEDMACATLRLRSAEAESVLKGTLRIRCSAFGNDAPQVDV